ncbi:MAG: hypothetical protein OXR66_02380 [Candidatus Woesearchaeota archaeon]|nr:hypothetical protein [Candidatus Woesearchaeota archaeon]
MTSNLLYLPEGKHMTTKEMIVQLLIITPLSNKQVHSQLRKRFRKSISYQGARRALIELTEDHVLRKEGRTYSINTTWVRRLHEFGTTLSKKFIERQHVTIIDKTTKKITLHSFWELGYFLINSMEQHILGKNEQLTMRVRHLYFPYSNKHTRDRFGALLKKHSAFIHVRRPFFGDRILRQWYKRYAKVRMQRAHNDADYLVFGNTVVQISFPKALTNELDKIYRMHSIVNFRLIERLVDLFYEEHKIVVHITKNPVLAEQLRHTYKSR